MRGLTIGGRDWFFDVGVSFWPLSIAQNLAIELGEARVTSSLSFSGSGAGVAVASGGDAGVVGAATEPEKVLVFGRAGVEVLFCFLVGGTFGLTGASGRFGGITKLEAHSNASGRVGAERSLFIIGHPVSMCLPLQSKVHDMPSFGSDFLSNRV